MSTMYTALQHHLQYNHFPPIHKDFIPVAEAAISLANDGEWDAWIKFPDRAVCEGQEVWEIIDGLHLGFFIDDDLRRSK